MGNDGMAARLLHRWPSPDQHIVWTDHPERASIPDAELTAINMPKIAQVLETL
jgi:hypothetical protein